MNKHSKISHLEIKISHLEIERDEARVATDFAEEGCKRRDAKIQKLLEFVWHQATTPHEADPTTCCRCWARRVLEDIGEAMPAENAALGSVPSVLSCEIGNPRRSAKSA